MIRNGFWLVLVQQHRGLPHGSGADSPGLATALYKYKNARALVLTVTVMLTVTVTVTATLTMAVTLCFAVSAEKALFRIFRFADVSAAMTS